MCNLHSHVQIGLSVVVYCVYKNISFATNTYCFVIIFVHLQCDLTLEHRGQLQMLIYTFKPMLDDQRPILGAK